VVKVAKGALVVQRRGEMKMSSQKKIQKSKSCNDQKIKDDLERLLSVGVRDKESIEKSLLRILKKPAFRKVLMEVVSKEFPLTNITNLIGSFPSISECTVKQP